jgi:uncharacterized protein DUF2188
MADGFVHTVHTGAKWVNRIEGDQVSNTASYTAKEMAVAAGRTEARRRQTEHVIHNEDGTIAERNSYGNDPAQRRG